ncbi:MAG: helix-turn-helix domain-containing protein [Candidatus Nitrosocaldus sp.]
MSIGVEDVILILIAYVAGMFVTSLAVNRDTRLRKSTTNEVYEHMIADLMARIDVIDLRMNRIYDITKSLYEKGSRSKYLERKEEDGINMINPKYASSKNENTTSMDSCDYKEEQNSTIITDKEHDEGRKSMDGRLTIISSNRDSHKSVAGEGDRKEVSRYMNNGGNGSTIEKVLHIIEEEGPKTSREIEERLGMSREHTARLMKRLYDMGYVIRDESKRPYRYMLASTTSSR